MSELASPPPRGIGQVKAPEPEFSGRTIAPERYWDRDFWKREWDQMWTRTWQIAALINQFKNPGDYVTFDYGPELIVCVMGKDRKIRAFYNVCQHRGMKVVQGETGCASRLLCAYHGWAYDLEGVLRVVPDEPDFQQGSPRGKRNLTELRCELWGGFVWINMDPNAKPLREALHPVGEQIENYPMDEMVRTRWVTVEGDFNWKLVQDNFNESYHVPFIHPQTKARLEFSYMYSQFDLYPSGHCRMLMPGAGPSRTQAGGEDETLEAMDADLKFWELNPEDFRGRVLDIRPALQAQKRKLGAQKGFDFSKFDDNMLTDNWHYTIFPNLSFSLKPDGNIWLRARPHPTDPEKCWFDMWYMNWFPKGQTKYYSNVMREWVDLETPAPHQVGKAHEVSCGQTIDQDIAVWSTLQKSLHSRGYMGDYLAWQERRVAYFHDNLDRYLSGEI